MGSGNFLRALILTAQWRMLGLNLLLFCMYMYWFCAIHILKGLVCEKKMS